MCSMTSWDSRSRRPQSFALQVACCSVVLGWQLGEIFVLWVLSKKGGDFKIIIFKEKEQRRRMGSTLFLDKPMHFTS